jgi:hypothetical protein
VHGIIDKPVGSSIHVTVPLSRRPTQHRPTRGIVIHRSNQSQQLFLGPFKLPRTRIEDTVLDLVAAAPTFDHAYYLRDVTTRTSGCNWTRIATTSTWHWATSRRTDSVP